MMILATELPIGNAFKSSSDLAFRCIGDISNNYIHIIPIQQYFIINQNKSFHIISPVEQFSSKYQIGELTKFNDIPSGTVIWSGSPFGLSQFLLTTNTIKHGLAMVAALGQPIIIDSLTRVMDLGPINLYTGPAIAFDKLRLCPNCSTIAFKTDSDIIDGVMTGSCFNCKCNFKLSWD